MLTNLTINNIVLIEKLEIDCKEGLTVLTGETGAGKSILLDAVGLAIGMRSSSSIIRKGTDKASVSAQFSFVDKNNIVFNKLKVLDIDIDENELILRRTIYKDGRSKAFVNDNAVSVSTLKDISASLVEIHGQFETSGLLQAKSHKNILDKYANHKERLDKLKTAWNEWQEISRYLAEAKANIAKSKSDEDYIKHMIDELEKLSPIEKEEEELIATRQKLKNAEKISEGLKEADYIISSDEGVEILLAKVRGRLERLASDIELAELDEAIKAIEQAEVEVGEAVLSLNSLASSVYVDEDMTLDIIEERLFALKDCARKHNCQISELPDKLQELKEQISLVENHEHRLFKLEKEEQEAKTRYLTLAKEVSASRKNSAEKFVLALTKELPSLKLDKVKFEVAIDKIENENNWNEGGIDKVEFRVAMNPGQSPTPLQKAASGGELSRLMLAFKVVLAEIDMTDVMVFDEIDSGIGGAVADAVGEHLKKLSKNRQVLVVTHSPQVASKGDSHFVIEKTQTKDTITKITKMIDLKDRCEEIARMLAGQKITNEARAAALILLEQEEIEAKEKVA